MRGSRIAVLGGSGFIGTRLVARLLAARHDARIGDVARSAAFPESWTACDVRDAEAVKEFCRGADCVYNLAAEHRDDVRPVSRYDEVNVGGARNLCATATALGIRRLVFASSVAVYGFAERELDESAPPRPFNDYGRTKLEAESVMRDWLAEDPTRSLTIVRPTVVFGEGNRGNVYNLLRQIASGVFVFVGDGTNRKSMAYVENVAAFLEFALGFGPGEHLYNYVDKPDFDMNELVAHVRTRLGRSAQVPRMPYAAGLAIGHAADLLARVVRRPLPVSAVRVEKFCANTCFSAARALASGFTPPVDLLQALDRTIAAEFGAGAGREASA